MGLLQVFDTVFKANPVNVERRRQVRCAGRCTGRFTLGLILWFRSRIHDSRILYPYSMRVRSAGNRGITLLTTRSPAALMGGGLG